MICTGYERCHHPMPQRLLEKAFPEPMSGCWLWLARLSASGYGMFKLNGRMERAHRVAYVALVGAIPVGMELDHLCRNRACVNPAHLEPVTSRENWLRGESRGARATRTAHCSRGHVFDEQNTRIETYSGRSPRRGCRACDRDRKAGRLAVERSAHGDLGQAPVTERGGTEVMGWRAGTVPDSMGIDTGTRPRPTSNEHRKASARG